MNKIYITSESACDIPPSLQQKYNIDYIIPQTVVLGDNVFSDGVDIVPQDIFDFVAKKNIMPKTSAPSVMQLKEVFEKYTKDGGSVIHFSLSSKLAVNYQNALSAAKEVGGDIYCVDTKAISLGIGMQMIATANYVKENPHKTAKEVFEMADGLKGKTSMTFCIDTLEYLYKGGRCSALARYGANMLRIHPVLTASDGQLVILDKLRGRINKVLERYVSMILRQQRNINKQICLLGHTYVDKEVLDEVTTRLQAVGFKEVHLTLCGSTISSHGGKGTMGMAFLTE